MNWTEDLSVGNTSVDNQHKKLFEIIDKLMIACNEKRGAQEIRNTLVFLEKYTRIHFRDEEALLLKTNYPKFKEHKDIHDSFTNDIHKSIEDYNNNGANFILLLSILKKCNEWILKHIMIEDKGYFKFSREKNSFI
ncbi:bacteriohemerythrin [Clostridium sp. DL1XJH146]